MVSGSRGQCQTMALSIVAELLLDLPPKVKEHPHFSLTSRSVCKLLLNIENYHFHRKLDFGLGNSELYISKAAVKKPSVRASEDLMPRSGFGIY